MSDLKPCPSCGIAYDPSDYDSVIPARVFAQDGYVAHFVTCRWCGMCGPRRRSDVLDFNPSKAAIARDNLAKQEAIDAWNDLPRKVEPQPIETFKDEWRGTHGNAQHFLFKHKATGWGEGYMLCDEDRFPVSLVCTDYLQALEDVTHWMPLPEVKE